MGIVSYAQNFEDVMLWRALGDVPDGFWIDIGAADPVEDSVTRAFSEHGWRGVNVEPTPAAFARLAADRPRDVNLNVALGAACGRTRFYECDQATLSTLDADISARNRADGRRVEAREIEVTTLAALCRRHAPADIHFLKIDVEGAEAQVLAGADFATWRPWVVVIEATVPQTQTDASLAWEPGLLASGYRFVWFDGLNRFYVAEERHQALARHFLVPVNVFDGYVLFDPVAVARAALPPPPAPVRRIDLREVLIRLARRLRSFLHAELRQEIGLLRHEVARLSQEVEGLRQVYQLRP